MVEPVSDSQFTDLMAALGPFERRPVVAVAVSGGGDSVALCLLADAWARRLGGRAVALTVDHGLRPESAAEAATVVVWMAARGIEHHVLGWLGAKPRAAIQAAARTARYDLLSGWCREAGVLHLLLAHQQEDQAETFLMRLERGSGGDGLAAMAAIAETAGVRLLRPLLGVARERLQATLVERGQTWIDDPSNRNEAFARVRVRRSLPAFAEAGYTPGRLGSVVADFGRHRRRREHDIARLLVETCALFPAGYAVVDGPALAAADSAAGALSRILGTVGGGAYPPARAKIDALLPWFAGDGAASSVTLARCRCQRRKEGVVVCRESRRLPAPLAALSGQRLRWDDRFNLAIGEAVPSGLTLAPLGRDGWAEIAAEMPAPQQRALPHAARLTLPAIRDSKGVFEVPFLEFRRDAAAPAGPVLAKVMFSPRNALSGIGFCLAPEISSTI